MQRRNSGILIINKPVGLTSHDCVGMVRKAYNIKKVGHAGTLDPIASGVMVVFAGNATRIIEYYGEDYKEYECEFKLGFSTDTYDITGNIMNPPAECEDLFNCAGSDDIFEKLPVRTNPKSEYKDFKDYVHGKVKDGKARYCIGAYSKIITEKVLSNISKREVEAVLLSMQGLQMQEPPVFSALKLNGKKLYEYAREGKQVKPRLREVDIRNIELLEFDEALQAGKFKALVSKGTYIRSICNDLGKALGSGACMTALARTRSGVFDQGSAVNVADLAEPPELKQWDAGLSDFGRISLPLDRAAGFKNGLEFKITEKEIGKSSKNAGKFRAHYIVEGKEGEELLGVVKLTADNFIKHRKVVCSSDRV